MNARHLRRGLAFAALVPLLTGLTACSDKKKDADSDGGSPAASKCGVLPTADPTAKLPDGFPTLGGQVLHEPSLQGKTQIVYALLDEPGFVEVRDELVTKLKAAGYTVPGTDQESVEAEAEFEGKQSGTIKVQPLCKGYVTIRYKFNG